MEAAQKQQGRVLQFKPATKRKAKLRMAINGLAGSGKTLSALRIAQGLVPGGRVALIDSERGSASKYADKFQFDTLELASFHPLTYVEAIRAAEEAGYDVIIIDSLSHAYNGKDGLLEQVDHIAARSKSGNSFNAWKDATPMQNKLLDAILGCKAHVIATMRVKMEYAQEKNERTGKLEPKKIGLAPIQRDGVEYEFDVVGDIDHGHRLIVSKSRCDALTDAVIDKPGPELGVSLREWLTDGSEAPAPVRAEPEHAPEPKAQPQAQPGRSRAHALAQELKAKPGPIVDVEPGETEEEAAERQVSGKVPNLSAAIDDTRERLQRAPVGTALHKGLSARLAELEGQLPE